MNHHENYWQKWIECSCLTEGIMIHIPKKEQTPQAVEGEEMEMAFFTNTFDHRFSFMQKLSMVWRMFTYGYPYADMVMLNKRSARELRDVLNGYLNTLYGIDEQPFMCQGDPDPVKPKKKFKRVISIPNDIREK